MSKMTGTSPFLLNDEGTRLIGLKHPDGSESAFEFDDVFPGTPKPNEYPYDPLSELQEAASAVSFHTTGRNLHTFRRALCRARTSHGTPNPSTVRVLLLTDSTGENVSQNFPQAHWVAALQRGMEARWPDVAFEFINCGVGGRQVKHVLGYNADLVTQNYLSQQVDNSAGYVANASQGETARQWPWTWMGPPPGVPRGRTGRSGRIARPLSDHTSSSRLLV
jgi:hypothetical protein